MVVEKLEITDEFEEDPPEPEEEEEEEEDEEDLEDPMDKIREDCQSGHHCAQVKSRFVECEDRVNSGNGEPEEHCTEELLDFLHCADHCLQGKLWPTMK
ncbi:cytochrome b-c1 complex subunit 6, mitochondrial-like isoform X1 [Branchiostoma lanceolatum]|uniref:cytochrome b-c1 complex subunit 6, mitochondrial-like isoform X1 n=1 Tax=Branchiostoma lanceolatum TaxID=7740 RepID=UPI003452A453